jgi:hypothetical protein
MISVDPLQLNFKRPLVNGSKDYFTIFNSGNIPVAFKIKTTAPKHYFVKPNHGRIEPGSSCVILVSMHSVNEEIGEAAALNSSIKCRDKFLVQVVPIKKGMGDSTGNGEGNALGINGGEADVSRWWNSLSEAQKEGMQEFKLRCNYCDESSQQLSLEESSALGTPSASIHSLSTPRALASREFDGEASKVTDQEKRQDQIEHLQQELASVSRALKEKTVEVEQLLSLKSGSPRSVGFSISPVMAVLLVLLAFLVGLLF